jgi:CDP-diacylglycerol--serine O-phosphatidyltransferase
MTSQEQNSIQPRSRGIYLLPNLFTTVSLFSGFYAIIASMRGHFDAAAIAVFIAMIMDFLDGRIARLTQTQSAFGKEYDSLSDMVSFGVAPALIMYRWAFIDLGKFGWLVAFIFTASVALRLARFNTQVQHDDKRYFQGLPCPAGAGIVAAVVWLGGNRPHFGLAMNIIFGVMAIFIAVLMVSNIRYNSFKELDIKDRIPFVALLIMVLIFAGIAIDPPSVLFAIFVIYGLSGPTLTLIRLRKARFERKRLRIH